MKTLKISELEKQGFKGIDTSLTISAFEYNMIWRVNELDENIELYYRNERNEWDCRTFDNSNSVDDFWEYFDWVNKDVFLATVGVSLEMFNDFDLQYRLYDLYSYYGSADVFGCAYSESDLEIEDN